MRLNGSFYERDVLEVAPELIGKKLFRQVHTHCNSFIITETEAYGGKDDQASHARFGKTARNAMMYERGGCIYMYFIYGMYWMMNIVTGKKDFPQAILIRGLHGIEGPGRITKALQIDRTMHGEDLTISNKIWIENGLDNPAYIQQPRVGINYAGEPWKSNPWRYIMVQPLQKV
jgi:DNA-3-methyladenine glycosylase